MNKLFTSFHFLIFASLRGDSRRPQLGVFDTAKALQPTGQKALYCSFFVLAMLLSSVSQLQAQAPPCVAGNTGGQVWRDFNNDGIRDAEETSGVAGVTVTAYDNSGVAAATAVTDNFGKYTFTTLSYPNTYRFEFSNVPAPYKPTFHQTGGSNDVQLVDAPACDVDYGVNAPMDYCQDNPYVATACYVGGDNSGTGDVLVGAPYSQIGAIAHYALANEIGSTWGLAYKRENNQIFSAAVIKRHAGLGPNGIGAIYKTDAANSTSSLHYDFGALAGTIGSNGARGLSTPGAPSYDTDGFVKAGKAGLGDLDISSDGTKLWVINLNDGKLYSLDADSPVAGSAVAAPAIPSVGCPLTIPTITTQLIDCGSSTPAAGYLPDNGIWGGDPELAKAYGAPGILNGDEYPYRRVGAPFNYGAPTTNTTSFSSAALTNALRLNSNSSVRLTEYAIPVPNGTYKVDMGFNVNATDLSTIGMDVVIEDVQILTGYTMAAALTAQEETYTATVNDGVLHIVFKNVVGKRLIINALRVTQLSDFNETPVAVQRPWGIKVHNEGAGDKIYVGLVCSAEQTGNFDDMQANVMVYDPTTNTWSGPVLSFPLHFAREEATLNDAGNWLPWSNSYSGLLENVYSLSDGDGGNPYAQPIIADIEFEDNGDMILGFLDRGGLQFGVANYHPLPPYGPGGTALITLVSAGDIMRAGKNSNTSWTIENDATVTNFVTGALTSTATATPAGPGGKEFYWGDNYSGAGHQEISFGGLGINRIANEIVHTALDAAGTQQNAGGLQWLNNTTGAFSFGIDLYNSTTIGSFAKAVGLGDLEILCAPAPLQIGNIVWNDKDRDGVQDPLEESIPGVNVALYKVVNGVMTYLANTTTSAGGEYYFTGIGTPGENWTATAGVDSILPNMNYKIVFGFDGTTPQFAAGQLTVAGQAYNMSVANMGQGTSPDQNDSDATLMDVAGNQYPSVSILTDIAGSSDFKSDAGFWICPTLTNPNPAAGLTLCEGDAGTDITVETDQNPMNGVRFVRFNSDQTATNGAETAAELAIIYAGGTVLSTVTPTGASDPYTATLTAAAAGWNAMAPGVYYVYAIINPDGGASCRPVQEIQVTIIDKPELSANDATVCETAPGAGATVDLVALVQNPDGASLTFTEGGNPVVQPLAVGPHTISVTGTSSLPGCETTVTFTVTVQPPAAPQSICPDQTFTLSAPAGLSNIKWFKDGVEVAQGNPYTVTMPGSYNYTADGGGGCSTGSCCPSVFVAAPCYDYGDAPNPYPSANHATVGAYLGNTRDSESSQQFSNGAIGDGADEDGVVRNSTRLYQCVTTSYTITVNGINPGETYYLSGWIDFNDDGVWDLPGEQIATDVAVTANGPFNITFTVPCGATITNETYERFRLSTQTGLSPTTASAPDGEIEDYAVAIAACAIVLNTTQTNVSCNGGFNGSVNLTPSNGVEPYSYDWSNDGPENPDDDTADLTGLAAGTYTVTVTDADGCTNTTSVTITQPSAVMNVISNIVNANCAGGDNGSATATANGGVAPYDYAWSYGFTENDVATSNATGLAAGGYNVTITDANGCTIVTAFEIADPTGVTLVVTAITNETCDEANNGSAMVTASGGTAPYTFVWSAGTVVTNSPNSTSSGLAAGTYLVTATDAAGCSAIQTIVVTQPTNLVAQIISFANETCPANNDGMATVTATGGTTSYTYAWGAGNAPTLPTNTGLAAGTYTVTVTDANSCTAIVSVVITEPTVLTVAINSSTNVTCNGGANGMATATPTGGTAPYLYLWSSGSTDMKATGLLAGTYTVTITDAHNCTATASVTLTQPTAVSNLISNIVNANCAGGDNGSATATASGGVAPYDYAWSYGFTENNVATSNATGLAAGGYNVTVTDANGCTTVTAFEIADPTGVTLVVTAITNETCDESNNGTATVLASGGTAPFTFVWSGGTVVTTSPSSTASDLAAGTYLVTATDANGCSAIQTIVITQPTNLVAQIVGFTNEVCTANNNGTATVSATGGITPYTYNWGAGAAPTSATNTGLAAGIYTVTVTDANLCTATASVTITEPPVLSVAIAAGANTSCAGGAATATATGGVPAYTYAWSNGAAGETVTGLAPGTYTVTVTDSHNCSATNTVTILVPSAVSVTIGSIVHASCAGGSNGSATATGAGGTTPYTFAWSTGLIESGMTTSTATNLAAGGYNVTITDADGCTAVAAFTITDPTGVTLVVTAVTNETCDELNNGTASVNASGGVAPYTFVWSGGTITTVSPNSSATGLAAGTYLVTATDNNGCQAVQTIVISEPTNVVVEMIATLNETCPGNNDGKLTANATGGMPGYSYAWSNGSTGNMGTSLMAGITYVVTVTDQNGCTATTSGAVTEPPLLTASATVTSVHNGFSVSCNGSADGTAMVNTTGGTIPLTYLWSNGSADKTASGLSAGTYTVTVTDSNGCTATSSVTLTQPTPVTNVMSNIVNANCAGGDDGSAVATASGGVGPYDYNWSYGFVQNNVASSMATGLAAGGYVVTVTDANGCTTVSAFEIADPTGVTLVLSNFTNETCDESNDGTAKVTANDGTSPYNFVWSDGQMNNAVAGPNAMSTATNLAAGVYLVTVTDANGCTAIQTVEITQPTNLIAQIISHVDEGCAGNNDGAATVNATGGITNYTYNWSGGAAPTAATNTGLAAGTYTVTVTDANLCTATASVTIGTVPPLVLNTVVQNENQCGHEDGTIDLTVSGGTTPYTYDWSNDGPENPDNDQDDLTGLAAGTYTVTVTDARGCTATTSVTLTCTMPASIGNYTWIDSNANGVQDTGEPVLPGVTVVLTGTDANGNAVNQTMVTDGNGLYLFDDLFPGTYKLTFVTPSGGYVVTGNDLGGNDALDSDANPAMGGMTVNEVLTAGENNLDYDAGYYIPASIGNFAWIDDNANGVQDPGETGLEGVTVMLIGTDGQGNAVMLMTTTDVDGAYLFSNLVPGTYKLKFTVPAGTQYELTGNDLGGNDIMDSDAIESMGGMTANEILTSGEHNPNYDAGFYIPASLGDYVWVDANANGIQDAGESPLPGVTVKLQDAAGNPVLLDADDVAIANQVSDGAGFYQFSNLVPGTYKVMFVNPDPTKYTLTLPNAGTNDAQDSDPTAAMLMTQTTVLGSGDHDPTLDAGFFVKAKVGDFVWHDLNGNGIQDGGEAGISGASVTLTGTDNQGNAVLLTATTDGNGMYMFGDLVPGTYKITFATPAGGYVLTSPDEGGSDALDSDAGPMGMTPVFTVGSGDTIPTFDAGYFQPAKIGNFVWNDLNANGIQDAGEPGIPGVEVILSGTEGDGDIISLVTTTDANGMYMFGDQTAGSTSLTPGTYKLTFVTPGGGFVPTQVDDLDATEATDSDANPAMGGMTINEVLVSGEYNPDYDAGYFIPASIGDFVWNDLDADGVQDLGETGIPGATVTLTGTDGQGNSVTLITNTDALGNYLFDNLVPGTYKLTFSTPTGFAFGSPLDAGANDALDSDANPAMGGMTINEVLTGGEHNPTYDAGFYVCPVISITGLPVQPICPGEDVDAIFITTTPGATTISWSGGAAIGLVNGSAPGPNATIPAFIATAEATVTITVTAVLGQCTVTQTFTLTVEDITPPVFDNCPTTVVMIGNDPDQCSGKLNWSIPVATDECATFVTVTQTGGPAPGSVVAITCPPTPQTITYTANDGNGNTSSCTFQVMVIDTEKPEFDADILMPGNVTVNCDAVPTNCIPRTGGACLPLTNADVNDNCTAPADLTVAFNEVSTQDPNPANCGHYNYMITRTWTITDCADNALIAGGMLPTHQLIHIQAITVQDTTPPVAKCKNGTVMLDKTGKVIIDPLSVDDGSTDNCAAFQYLTFSVMPNQFTCANLGPNQVTLSVTDPCGNVGTCTAIITVTEGIAPCTPVIDVQTVCMGNLGNATTLDNGQFMDVITVKSLAMQTWSMTINNLNGGKGAYSITSAAPPANPSLLPTGTLFTAGTADGIDNDGDGTTDEADEMIYYTLKVVHVECKGYDVTVSNAGAIGMGISATTTRIENKACYPTPYFCNLITDPFCLGTPPFTIEVCEFNNAVGSVVPGSMMVNGVPTTIFDPVALGLGTHTVMATFDAGIATTNLVIDGVQLGGTMAATLTDPGCAQKITQLVHIVETPNTLICNDFVYISMDADCQVTVTADDVLEGSYFCYDDFLVEVDKTLPLGNGPWLPATFGSADIGKTYAYHVVHVSGGANICWGNIKIEDKLAPALTCPANTTIACSESTEVSHTGNIVIQDCSATTTVVDEEYIDYGQCSDPRGQITRTWLVTDAWGNQSTCTQTITITPFTLAAVAFPDDVTINCESAYLNANATDPNATGRPSINGFPIGTGGLCTASISYSDEIFDICPGSYEVLRTWKVRNTCLPISADNPIVHVQIITVADLGGPAFICPPAVTVSTDPLTCCATAALPSMIVSEGCSNITNLEAKVTGTNPTNGNVITFTVPGYLSDFPGNNYWNPDTLANFNYTQCLPLGVYNVRYKASDLCGNTSFCYFELTVADLIPPVASCDQTTVVGVNGDDPHDCYTPANGCDGAGVTWVKATTFDDGSYDNCNQVKFTVRRMAPYSDCINNLSHDPCYANGASEFDLATAESDSIKFYCCESGTTQTVILRVYQIDINGNLVPGIDGEPLYNECMIQVEVQDKIKPICQSPANVSVTCEQFDPSLWLYGKADIFDNCCLDTTKVYQGQCGLTHSVNYSQFDTVCHKGTIVRTFRAFDCHGQSSQCTQRIVVTYEQDYYVRFPNDVIITVCDGTGNYGEPTFFGEDCELLGVSHEDEIFTVVPDACFKIERHWKVINWCTYNPNGNCINVPNPNPNATSNHASNLPGPIVSPIQTSGDPWKSTIVKILPTDPNSTNYSIYYDANANCYTYKQIIKIIDTQDPVVECPDSTVTVCDVTPNDAQLWNASYWWDNANQSHDLCDAPSDICVTATDLCSGSNINIEYQLFLDLDGDGVMETVVNSTQLGNQAGGLGWNNILFGNFTGAGVSRQFDDRLVPTNQKWGFAIQETVTGTNKTACVKFNTFQSQNSYVTPQLPHGNHKIKWFVSDGCGNETVCEYPITIKDCKPPTVVCLNGLSVNIMPTGMIQLWANDFLQYGEDNCTQTQFIKYGIRKCGTGTGFPYDAQGNPITSVTFDCSELGTQCVELWAIDLAGNADYCETYVIVQDNNGNCPNGSKVNVSGALKTEIADGVEEAEVNITGALNPAPPFSFFDLTDNGGLYAILNSVPVAADLTVTPLKDDNPLNGVTTYDLVLISKHILGIQPLGSPYKMIAADANKSNSITTFDIVELRKLILGIYQELPNNTSWRFVDKSHAFPNPLNPFMGAIPENISMANVQAHQFDQDFVGVKIGDVNNTVVANSLMVVDDRAVGTLVFDVRPFPAFPEGEGVRAGQEFEVSFTADQVSLGYQMTLNLAGLEVVEIMGNDKVTANNFGVFDDALTVSIDGAESFTVKFRATKSGKLSDMIALSGRITKAESYAMDNERMAVALRFDGKTIAGIGFELYQNQPNPFINKTMIGFHLPEAANTTLTVFDETGRLVHTQKGDFAKGYNVFTIDRGLIGNTGALWYRVETSTDSAVRTMIQTN